VTVNALYVCEGTSDRPLAEHVTRLFRDRGIRLVMTSPDFDRIPGKVGAGLEDKLRAARRFGRNYGILVVHRDSDNQGVDRRRAEIAAAAERVFLGTPVVAVIPVRMTEAWLLLDECALRRVAGNPNGRKDLNLPKRHEVERIADPKERLREILVVAAECTGRRLDIFKRRFAEHRRLLLERLDPSGPVADLVAWRSVVAEVDRAVALLGGAVQGDN
jgi:hypothetical protein